MKNKDWRLVFIVILFTGVRTSFSQYKSLYRENESVILDDRSVKQWAKDHQKLKQAGTLHRYLNDSVKAWGKEYQKVTIQLESSQSRNFYLKLYLGLVLAMSLLLGVWIGHRFIKGKPKT